MRNAIADGNDVFAVYREARLAVQHAREGNGPTLIECKTVRWERHSAFSAGRYEDPEDRERWRKVDPLPRFRAQLLEAGIPESQLQEAEDRAKTIIREAVEFAISSPSPSPESLLQDIFAE